MFLPKCLSVCRHKGGSVKECAFYHWAACGVEGQGFLGRAEFGSSRTALGFLQRFADGRRRPRHFDITEMRGGDGPQGTDDVDRLGAVGGGARSQREHFLTCMR